MKSENQSFGPLQRDHKNFIPSLERDILILSLSLFWTELESAIGNWGHCQQVFSVFCHAWLTYYAFFLFRYTPTLLQTMSTMVRPFSFSTFWTNGLTCSSDCYCGERRPFPRSCFGCSWLVTGMGILLQPTRWGPSKIDSWLANPFFDTPTIMKDFALVLGVVWTD